MTRIATFYLAYGAFARVAYVPDGDILQVDIYRDAQTAHAGTAVGLLAEDIQDELTATQMAAIGIKVSAHEAGIARCERALQRAIVKQARAHA